jgi:hypothetical protein
VLTDGWGADSFRFKIKYEAFGHVWLDLTDDTRKVPICDGKITLKVLPMGEPTSAPTLSLWALAVFHLTSRWPQTPPWLQEREPSPTPELPQPPPLPIRSKQRPPPRPGVPRPAVTFAEGRSHCCAVLAEPRSRPVEELNVFAQEREEDPFPQPSSKHFPPPNVRLPLAATVSVHSRCLTGAGSRGAVNEHPANPSWTWGRYLLPPPRLPLSPQPDRGFRWQAPSSGGGKDDLSGSLEDLFS